MNAPRAFAAGLRSPRRLIALALAIGLVLAAIHDILKNEGMRPEQQLTDFRAFYCAARAGGSDPYVVEPLRACEHAVSPKATEFADPAFVLPAPVPGYVIAFMRAFAWAPFGAAALLLTLLSLTAGILTVAALTRLGARPVMLSVAALSFADVFLSIFHGQLIALEIALIACAAWMLHDRRWTLAGMLTAATLLEPHIGGPVCLAVFWAAPRARAAIALGLVALGAVSIAAIGPQANLEYVTAVMPAQVRSEISYQDQYSLTYLLQFAGANTRTALSLGYAWYLMTTLAGVVAGDRLARSGRLDIVPLAAAALSITGGPYVHITQMAVAIPLALVLRSTSQSATIRTAAACALVLLCVPWPLPYEAKALYLVSGFALAGVTWYVTGASPLKTAAIAGAFLLMLNLLENRPRIVNPGQALTGIRATDLASSAWAQAARRRETRDLAYFSTKVLTWAGLAFAVVALAGALREPAAPANETRAPSRRA